MMNKKHKTPHSSVVHLHFVIQQQMEVSSIWDSDQRFVNTVREYQIEYAANCLRQHMSTLPLTTLSSSCSPAFRHSAAEVSSIRDSDQRFVYTVQEYQIEFAANCLRQHMSTPPLTTLSSSSSFSLSTHFEHNEVHASVGVRRKHSEHPK